MTKKNDVHFAFFGTPEIAATVLDELELEGFVPQLVVTQPDKKKGRRGELAAPPTKKWAQKRNIPVLQPIKITDDVIQELQKQSWDVLIVAAYGKILPKALLDIPQKGTLNVHPSLLPRLRGPSPIRSAILSDEKETGVTVMLLDEEMDHGPILAQTTVTTNERPPYAHKLEEALAREGGKLLAATLPKWIDGTLEAREQDHKAATYCSMLKKEDAEINLSDDAHQNLLKIRGYAGWPGAFTFFERNGKNIRVTITDAHLDARGNLILDTVIPEGKREMPYQDFLRSGAKPVQSAV